MAKVAARKASLYLDNASGACQGLSPYVSSVTLNFSSEATDVTGFGNDNRERASDGIRDFELSMEGFWSSGATETDAILSAIRAAGGSTLFRFGPAGSVAGCPMYAGCAVMTSYEINEAPEDAAGISFTLGARSGSLTRTTASW